MDVAHVALILVYMCFIAGFGPMGELNRRSMLVCYFVSLVEMLECASFERGVLKFGLLAETIKLCGFGIGAVNIKVPLINLDVILSILLDSVTYLVGSL